MSVNCNKRFKKQLRVQLCKTCVEYKHQRDFYMQKCKYYEKLLAEYRNKSANKETSLVEAEVTQAEFNLPCGTEDRDADAEQHMNDKRTSICNWNEWQSVIPKIEPPDSPLQEPTRCDENVTASEMGIFTATTKEPDMGEVSCQRPKDNAKDANKIKMCRWMLEDRNGVLHMCGDVSASVLELSTHVSEEHVAGDKQKGYVCRWRDCKNHGIPFKQSNTLVTHLATHMDDNPRKRRFANQIVPRKDAGTDEASQGDDVRITDSVVTGGTGEPKEPEGPCIPPGKKKKKLLVQREACYQVCHWEVDNKVCGVTLNVEDLLTHVSRDHVGTEDSTRHVCTWHACDRKDRVFFYKRELMIHIQAHVCGNLFQCRTKACKQWCSTEEELTRHRKLHEGFSIARPKLPCPHKPCRRMFWNAEYLKRHVDNKHTTKEYRCPEESCGTVFKTMALMNEHHLRVHQGVELYKCTVEGCGRAFNYRNHLIRHVRLLHLQEKPFRCTVPGCNMEFAYPTTYETHRKTHSDPTE